MRMSITLTWTPKSRTNNMRTCANCGGPKAVRYYPGSNVIIGQPVGWVCPTCEEELKDAVTVELRKQYQETK